MAGHKGTKGKTGDGQRPFGRHLPDHLAHVGGLAMAFVVDALAGADTAEIETHRPPTGLHKGTGQGLHHLVGHGAAEQRMRVSDHGGATGRGSGLVEQRLDGTGATLQRDFLRGRVHQRPALAGVSRRSTTWPFLRWLSTISSMSAWSTKVYQVPSG